MSKPEYFWGTGRRKSAVARVRLSKGEGNITINKKEMKTFFTIAHHQNSVLAPLLVTSALGKYDVWANVKGGGITGQAEAVLLGLARALCKIEPELEEKLRNHGHLTRDSRMTERKKYGFKKARKSFQFSKR